MTLKVAGYWIAMLALAEGTAAAVERFQPAVVYLNSPAGDISWCEHVAVFRVSREFARSQAQPEPGAAKEVVLWRL